MFQMVKFSITAKQIPGTQARLPENPTDHGQNPLCLCGNQRQRKSSCKIRFSSCLSSEAASPSAYSCLPHSPLLTAAQPESCYTFGGHIVMSQAGREGCWHILSHHPRAQVRGDRWARQATGEPGILSTLLCKLIGRVRLGTGERR